MKNPEKFDEEELLVPPPQTVYVRLINGDELVGDCLGEDPDRTIVVLKSPMLMSEMVNPYNQSQAIVLSKFVLFGDSEVVPIRKDHIIAISTVIKEMRDFYLNSVHYTNEFTTPHMVKELSQSNKAIEQAIVNEQMRRFNESVKVSSGKNIITPPNTSIH